MQAEMNESLAKAQLVSALALRQSKMDAEQLGIRDEIAQAAARRATRIPSSRGSPCSSRRSIRRAR